MSRGDRVVIGLLILLGLAGAAVVALPVLWTALYSWGLSQQQQPTVPLQASELVCHEADPDVVARIERALTAPGGSLRAARAVHSAVEPHLWLIAADVQGGSSYEGNRDVGVWLIVETSRPVTGSFEAIDPIYSYNDLAAEVGIFAAPSHWGAKRNVATAEDCTKAALPGLCLRLGPLRLGC